MSKYNEYLTEIVYQIDDIIYEFYRKSNDLIATKRNTEELLSFRDETITTINNMNVRALEMIASFKKDQLVEERSEILLQRNKDILDSAQTVIENSPSKGELFNEVKDAAKDALKYTSDKVQEFQSSDTYANIKDYTEKGYVKLRDAVQRVSSDKRVQDGVQTAKDFSKEALKKGEEAYHKGEAKLKDWWEETKAKKEAAEEAAKDAYEDVKDAAEDTYEDVKDKVEDTVEDVKDASEDKFEDFKELSEDLKEKAEETYEELKEASEDKIEDIKENLEDEFETKREAFKELKDKIEDRVEHEQDVLDKEIEEIEEALKDLGLDDKGDHE